MSHDVINSVNRILRKNYVILSTFNAAGKNSTSKNELLKRGYRFDYFTCTSITRSSQINYFCYDQGYRELENNKITLVRRTPDDNLSATTR